jgi:hypothetical protein
VAQAEIEMLRSGYEAVNRGDRLLNAGTYRGRAEISRFFEDQRGFESCPAISLPGVPGQV